MMALVLTGVQTVAAQKAQQFSLRVNKQKTVTKEKMTIKFLSLEEDSRCAEGLQCVWAGNARIKIQVTGRRGSETFEINTNTGARGAAFNGYAITLDSLTPTPKANIRIDKNGYTATFTVRKLSR
jgi:hypothetical protein